MSRSGRHSRHIRSKRVALPPPGMRQMLGQAKVWAVLINMESNIAAIRSGEANVATLWDFIGGLLTWQRVAFERRFTEAEAVMLRVRNQVIVGLIERWDATGAITMPDDELKLMTEALPWIEALAENCDETTARAAAIWGQQNVDMLRRLYPAEGALWARQPGVQVQAEVISSVT